MLAVKQGRKLPHALRPKKHDQTIICSLTGQATSVKSPLSFATRADFFTSFTPPTT
jgi:hypothetical protein